jgi:Family of unknown function (DUF6196)
MYVSQESAEQTQQRLLRVIALAEFKIYERLYIFEEFPLSDFQAKANPEALAFVRDEQVWSQLICADDSGGELFKIFSFHFAENLDNSGFVGWLASHLKQRIGTGVFVVCGQNSDRGGIFDYWGCPAEVAETVLREVESLIKQGKSL